MMQTFKIGIIGAGMRTIFLVNEVLKRKELEIVVVSDVSQHSMDQICSIYDKNWDKYLNYKDLLNRDDIEGVIIASPDYEHEEQAIAAFEAGKHLFLEKPIATTLEGGKKVLEARDKSGKTLLIGFVLRYNKAYQKMKELIGSGLIGELKTGWV
ncbi:MAG: oxidoreductase, partial [Clostridia bacterium]|nr:oxidoreductase [Clostridia bacterium]